MDRPCCLTIILTLILPWTAGNLGRLRTGKRYFDGTISALVLFLILLAFVIVFSASRVLRTAADIRLGVALCLLITLMLCAVIMCVGIGYSSQRHGLEHIVVGGRKASVLKVQVLFLWIFGLFSILFSVFLLLQQIECNLWSFNGDPGGFYLSARFGFNLVMILFLFTETIFITYFSQFYIRTSTAIHYCMCILAGGNISTLAYIIIMDDNFPHSYTNNQTESNHNASLCLQNGTLTEIIVKSKNILSPGFLEYGLLCITIILETWLPNEELQNSEHNSSTYEETDSNDALSPDPEQTPLLPYMNANSVPVRQARYTPASHLITLCISSLLGLGYFVGNILVVIQPAKRMYIRFIMEIYNVVSSGLIILVTSIGFFCLARARQFRESIIGLRTRESIYLLSGLPNEVVQNSEHDSSAYGETDSKDASSPDIEQTPLLPYMNANSVRQARHTPASHLVTLCISSLLGLGNFVGNIIMVTEPAKRMYIRFIMEIYNVIVSSLIILVTSIGFFCLARARQSRESLIGLRTRESIYLLSGFGVIFLHVSGIVLGMIIPYDISEIILASNAIDLVQVYFGIVFLLQATRFKRSDLQSDISVFAVVINLFLWMTDSFILSQFTAARIPEKHYVTKTLTMVIYKVIFPITVFFRFSPFLEYYATFKMFCDFDRQIE